MTRLAVLAFAKIRYDLIMRFLNPWIVIRRVAALAESDRILTHRCSRANIVPPMTIGTNRYGYVIGCQEVSRVM
ncbi:MAG: hypothetical protein ACK2UO_08140 [Caldilineaceae bacterium]